MIDELKRYPEYKSTSSIWLKPIPAHWDALPLGRILVERKEKNDPIKTKDILSLGLATGVIPYSDKKTGGNKRKDDLSQYMLAYPGDIVVNSMNVIVGSVGLSKYFGAVSPVYYMLRPRQTSDLVRFFDAIFQDGTFQKSLFGLGNGIMVIQSKSSGKLNTIRMRIPMSRLRQVLLPYPPLEEQAAIVRFLDHANARIERAIRAKRKLIALLNEQKQAIIHRAVTRGLDPAVKLKPSGIPWLGDLPEHWEVRPLKQLLTRMDYGTSENARGEGRIRVLGMGHIRDGRITLPSTGGLSEIPKGLLLEQHDLLFNRTNSPDLVGKVGLFEGTASDEVTFASYLVRLRLKTGYDPYWLNYLLNSFRFWGFARSQALVSLHQANLNSKRYGQMLIPVPPSHEHPLIVELIRSQVGGIEAVIVRTEREIELLREYRTTLTAEVVTGKLDVRAAAKRLPAEAAEPMPADDLPDEEDDVPEEGELE